MKKVIKWGVIIFIGLLVLFSLSDDEEKSTQPENPATANETFKLDQVKVGSSKESNKLQLDEERRTVTPEDVGVTIYQEYTNITRGQRTLSVQEIRPDGTKGDRFTKTYMVGSKEVEKGFLGWSWYYTFEDDDLEDYPGEWRVLLYVDGTKKGETTFKVKASRKKPELEVLDWSVKSKKAGYPGNYRTEAYVEGVIENVGDETAKDVTIGAKFMTKTSYGRQQVSVNYINQDKLRPGATWRFRISCPAGDDMVDGATLLTPK